MPEMQIFMAGAPFIDDPDDEVITRFNKFANFGPSFVRLSNIIYLPIFREPIII